MKALLFDKIRSKLALVFIAFILISEHYWLFGILFVVWGVIDIMNKSTHLLEPITRQANPVLYWIIILMWFFFAFYNFTTASYYF